MLELRNVSKVVAGVTHIGDVSLKLQHGTLNVLLGPTLSGKTSLMRLMAGLDAPTSGSVWFDGVDVTGVPVQKRKIAMVYQQFINYPAMTVYENIASPLRVAGADRAQTTAVFAVLPRFSSLRPIWTASAQPLGWPAAAHGARKGYRQERRIGAVGRTACQSRLQAARGTSGRTAKDLCRDRRDLRLCDYRASRSAAAWRQYCDACGRPSDPIRSNDRGVSQAERSCHGKDLFRPSPQYNRAAQGGRGL